MTAQNTDPLLVELFLSNCRIQGVTYEVHERRRLVDVLTDGAHALRLEAARVLLGASSTPRELPSINVEKRSIVAAIPHETRQQVRHRSMLTTTVGKTETRPFKATLLLPPFIAKAPCTCPAVSATSEANSRQTRMSSPALCP
jgi:hypothetical protein